MTLSNQAPETKATGDIALAYDDLRYTLEAYRVANDERLAELPAQRAERRHAERIGPSPLLWRPVVAGDSLAAHGQVGCPAAPQLDPLAIHPELYLHSFLVLS